MRKMIILLLMIPLYLMSFSACSRPQQEQGKDQYISDSEFLLDTIVTIKIYGYSDESIFDDVFDYIKDLENTLSVHVENSDLWKLKQNSGGGWAKVSEDTMQIIKRSIEISKMSKGMFDITAGPLINLWAIDPPEGHFPTEKEREDAIALISYKDIEIDEANNSIRLKKAEMEANLGAIAKGYIADKVKAYLKDKGINRAIINLGGNVLLLGGKADGSDFRIGIQDPDSERGAYLGLVKVSDKSIVSSGTYERYFIHKGKKYHHILNPFTGFPQENNLKGVSVISNYSTDGDAFSTAVFLLGLEKGMQLVENVDGVETIFITKKNELHLSSGLVDAFELAPDSGYAIVD